MATTSKSRCFVVCGRAADADGGQGAAHRRADRFRGGSGRAGGDGLAGGAVAGDEVEEVVQVFSFAFGVFEAGSDHRFLA